MQGKMLADLLIPLIAVGLAELGDKTQLSILLLSTRTKKYLHLLLGVMLAFLIVDGAGILIGSYVTTIIPIAILRIASGIIFIVFGVLILVRSNKEVDTTSRFKSPFLSGFALIFLTEWGDKTQIAAALFAMEYNPLLVMIGTMIALALLSILAIYLGKFIGDKISSKIVTKVAGIVFIVIGASFLISYFI